MTALVVTVVVLVPASLFLALVLGYRLGSGSPLEDMARMRMDTFEAARQMQAITRQTIEAMLNEAERQRRR